jgi:hypothetical protein
VKDWVILDDTFVRLRDVTSFEHEPQLGGLPSALKVRLRCGTVLTFRGDCIRSLLDAFGIHSEESA